MKSRHNGFDSFYDDQAAAHRQFYTRDSILDRFKGSSIILTAVVLLVTLLIKFYSTDGTLQGVASPLGNLAWDAVVFVVPAPLLFALDNWVNSPASPSPMLDTQQTPHAAKSDALRRVMGLDRPGGLMSTVFRARTRAFSMTGMKIESDRPPGLGNMDNSCYQNSILQGLAALPSMSDYLSTCVRGVDENARDGENSVALTLRALISNLNDVSNNGKTLWTPSLLKSMSTWTQQDAQEYYSKILDDIDKGAALAAEAMTSDRIMGLEGNDCGRDESAASQHSDDSGYQSVSSGSKLSDARPVRNPLEGLLAQRVACVQCGHSDGLSMIPFNCLTLSLGLDKNQHDLYERLDSYSKVETIEGVDCPKCTLLKLEKILSTVVKRKRASGLIEERLAGMLKRLEEVETALEEEDFSDETIKETCHLAMHSRVSTTKTKQMVIARPPRSLAIHVNRSVFDPSTFNMMKNSAPVEFPMMLDLGPWCLGSSRRNEKPCSDGDEDSEEQWQLDPTASMVAGDMGPSRLTGPIYELRAAVTHYGRHENGHYVCYRKYPPSSPPKGDEGAPSADDVIDDSDGGVDDERVSAGTTEGKHHLGGGHEDREMRWWRLSDHNVSKSDEETVMSLAPGVFMLFYECVDPSMILQCDEDETQDGLGSTNGESETKGEPEATGEGEGEGEGESRDMSQPVSADGANKQKDERIAIE